MMWCRSRNLSYVLNMAGSPLQRELQGISYPLTECKEMKIDMNDVDAWDGRDMEEGFEKGARFIQDAWEAHKSVKEQNRKLAHTGSKIIRQPPRVFVHCVAGVNRSPMVAVWWLVKYHGLHLRDAWDLVRKRRDSGAHWKDVALGGECPPDDYVPNPNEYNGDGPSREFQHPIAKPGSTASTERTKAPSSEKRPYPKAMWYINAARILQPYFKRHWNESDIKSPPRTKSAKPPPPPPPTMTPLAAPANMKSSPEIRTLSSSSTKAE